MTECHNREKEHLPDHLAIRIEKLGKSYKIYKRTRDRLKQLLWGEKRKFYKEFRALSNIDIDIKKGESIGILGANGAGKSTLLQLISGITPPTEGEVLTNGKIAALLELGTGFNPEWNGHDNIYLYGSVLGLSKEEINRKYQDIINFADIGEFISQPVKTYSSGMQVRLAFAVAIHIEPDILIIDEALSVGDTTFQKKCLDCIQELHKKGTTILFVTHAVELFRLFCSRVIWLEKGRCKMVGDASAVVASYLDSLHHIPPSENNKKEETAHPSKTPLVHFEEISLNKEEIKTFDELRVSLVYRVNEERIPGLIVGVALHDREKNYIFGTHTPLSNITIPETRGIHRVDYTLPQLPLMPGTYYIGAVLSSNNGVVRLDHRPYILQFQVTSGFTGEGIVHLPHRWNIIEKPPEE